MWRNRHAVRRASLAVITLAAAASFPFAAVAGDVPAAVTALLPEGAKLGNGDWEVFETEFGKTYGGDLQASSFPGQRPSCAYAGTPELHISLKGDTAFENPPMLDMAISIYEQDVQGAPAAMSSFVSNYVKDAPDVTSVGMLREEQRPNGHLVYVEYQENCTNHPNGAKTRLSGFARRGATQLEFNFVVALDSAAAIAMAGEILTNFDQLDIAGLTR